LLIHDKPAVNSPEQAQGNLLGSAAPIDRMSAGMTLRMGGSFSATPAAQAWQKLSWHTLEGRATLSQANSR
jgi:hypothetical protein